MILGAFHAFFRDLADTFLLTGSLKLYYFNEKYYF